MIKTDRNLSKRLRHRFLLRSKRCYLLESAVKLEKESIVRNKSKGTDSHRRLTKLFHKSNVLDLAVRVVEMPALFLSIKTKF